MGAGEKGRRRRARGGRRRGVVFMVFVGYEGHVGCWGRSRSWIDLVFVGYDGYVARWSVCFPNENAHVVTVDLNWKVSGQTLSSSMSTVGNTVFLWVTRRM